MHLKYNQIINHKSIYENTTSELQSIQKNSEYVEMKAVNIYECGMICDQQHNSMPNERQELPSTVEERVPERPWSSLSPVSW